MPRVTPRGIAGAAALIAVLTIASRIAGFARTVVFAGAVGPNELGDISLTANVVPTIVFEIVAGGALAPMVVPLRVALDAIQPWEIGLSIVLMLATIWILFVVGARVYAGAVLQTGGRMKLRDAWRART